MSTIALENARKIQDASFVANVALPAQNSNANSTSFNLIQSYAASEHYAIQVDVDASNVNNNQTITAIIQDSADNVTFANIAELGSTVITGNASNISAQTTDVYRLPPTTRQYIRGQILTSATAGTLTGNAVFTVRF